MRILVPFEMDLELEVWAEVLKENSTYLKNFTSALIHEVSKKLHDESSFHVDKIKASEKCGCFHCLSEFQSLEIKEWTDEGKTALCPRCGIDSVLPFYNENLLIQMNQIWFDYKSIKN